MADASRDWEAVRASADIQFAPLPPATPPAAPGWLRSFGEWLQSLFEPMGKALGVSWPVLEKLLIALAAIAVLWIAWRLAGALIARLRRAGAGQEEWQPGREAAIALLEDADGLAADGRFAEAVHLLLQRSVGEIARDRPDWLHPASTAREIAGSPFLPERARLAFGEIAALVERGFFALRDLGPADWQAARAAYARFALAEARTQAAP